MKICPNCSKINPNDYVQCECGEDIENVPQASKQELRDNSVQSALEYENEKPEKAGSGVFGILCFLGIVVSIIFFFVGMIQLNSTLIGVIACISMLVFSTMMYAVKRIIDLLFEISNKLEK